MKREATGYLLDRRLNPGDWFVEVAIGAHLTAVVYKKAEFKTDGTWVANCKSWFCRK